MLVIEINKIILFGYFNEFIKKNLNIMDKVRCKYYEFFNFLEDNFNN